MPKIMDSTDNIEFIAEERYGSTNFCIQKYTSNKVRDDIKITRINKNFRFVSVFAFLRDVFLPDGFPDSVSEDYIEYQMWDSLQAFCSSITGGLSTRAILKGVGVGNEAATVTSATITWLLKDGSGMIGRILFAWKRGTQLDSECKKWRLFADILNDGALFLDLSSPFFPQYFTLIVCVSGVMKSIVGVAGGATRAALTQHQAKANNMANVSAKDGSQETMVNLIALICSLILIPAVAEDLVLTWLIFAIFTTLHMFCNYKAVKSICMNSFNQERYELAVSRYLLNGLVPKVDWVNSEENVWVSILPTKCKTELGTSLTKIVMSKSDFTELIKIFSNKHFLLNIHVAGKTINLSVVLHRESDTRTQLEALFQASLIKFIHQKGECNNLKGRDKIQSMLYDLNTLSQNIVSNRIKILDLTKTLSDLLFNNFLENAKNCGWNTERVLFGVNEWRATWDYPKLYHKE